MLHFLHLLVDAFALAGIVILYLKLVSEKEKEV